MSNPEQPDYGKYVPELCKNTSELLKDLLDIDLIEYDEKHRIELDRLKEDVARWFYHQDLIDIEMKNRGFITEERNYSDDVS